MLVASIFIVSLQLVEQYDCGTIGRQNVSILTVAVIRKKDLNLSVSPTVKIGFRCLVRVVS